MIKSQAFYWSIIVLVFLNTVVLATEHYAQPRWLDDFQEATNIFFIVLFTVEMALKMYSLGFSVSSKNVKLKIQISFHYSTALIASPRSAVSWRYFWSRLQ